MGYRGQVSDLSLHPHVGSVLGERYELVRHIARGGMGDVYEAHDEVLDRRVAVKLYRAASPSDRGRFDAEVRLLAGLDHPTLVRVFDAGPHGDDAYVVLELVDGPPLAKVLATRGALPPAEVAALGADLADALDSIHARQVVHRDVTTSNILCDPDGRARLVDFGIARLLGTPRVTATLTTVGTAAFMAPEQVKGEEVTPAADVYALGLVLLELLTGRRAFEGTAHEVAIARLMRDPDTTTDVPGGWRPLLAAMTSQSADDRPRAASVRDRLRALVAAPDESTAAVPVIPPPPGAVPLPVAALDPTTALAATHVLAGRTEVLEAVPHDLAPAPIPVSDASRRRIVFAAVAAVAAVLLIVVAAQMGRSGLDPEKITDGMEADSSSTTTPASSRPTPTTTPTTVATTLPPTTTTVGSGIPGPDFDPFAGNDNGKKDKDDN